MRRRPVISSSGTAGRELGDRFSLTFTLDQICPGRSLKIETERFMACAGGAHDKGAFGNGHHERAAGERGNVLNRVLAAAVAVRRNDAPIRTSGLCERTRLGG